MNGAEQLVLVKGVRVRLRVLVSLSRVVIDTMGGLGYVQHAIQDVGFEDVYVSDTRPVDWGVPDEPVSFPDWLLWVEATPTADAKLSAQVVPGAVVTGLWPAPAKSSTALPSAPPGLPAPGAGGAQGGTPTAAIVGASLGVLLLAGLVYLVAQE